MQILTFLKYYTSIKGGGESIPYINLRTYAFQQDILLKRALRDKVKEGAKKAFGKGGIMPVPAGAVHIIPDFTEPVDVESIFFQKPEIEIVLLEKEERTSDLLEAVKKEFEIAMGNKFVVTINSQPEELFVTV